MMIFTLAFILLLVIPGFLFISLFTPDQPWFQRIPVAFPLSLSILGLPAVLLLNLHAPLPVLTIIALAAILLLTYLNIRMLRNQKKSTQSTNQPALPAADLNQPPHVLILIPTCLAAAAAIYIFITTAAIRDFGDHWFYLHFIRRYLDLPLNPATNPIVGMDISPGTLSRAATNGWWVLIALVVQVSGQPLLESYWLYLPPILMFVSLFAFYNLAWELFENHQAALTAVLLQLLLYFTTISSHDWIGQGFFTRIAEDKYLVWLILLPVSFSLLLHFLKTNQLRFLVPLAAAIAAIAITHPFGLLQFAFGVACFALIHLPLMIVNRSGKLRVKLTDAAANKTPGETDYIVKKTWDYTAILKTAVLIAPLLLFLTIPIIQQLFSGTAPLLQFIPSELQTPPNDTHLMVLSAKDNRYLLHPHLIFNPLTLLGILLALFLLPKIKHSITNQFLFATTIIPLLLLYNPITAPLFGRFLTPLLLWRVIWILSTSLVIANFIHQLAKKIQAPTTFNQNKWSKTIQSIAALVIILALIFITTPNISDSLDLLHDYKTRTVTDGQQELLIFLCENEQSSSVLVADPLLNTLIPSCAPQIQLLTYRIFQASQTAAEEIERFYQSNWISPSTISFLERWQVDRFIIPNQAPIAAQINQLPNLFVKQYTNQEYSLYEFYPDDNPVISGNEAFIRGNWGQAQDIYSEAKENSNLAQYGLAQTWLKQGKDALAEAAFLETIALDPTFIPAYLALAGLYTNDGRITSSEVLLLQSLETNPTSLILHETLGDIYLELDHDSAAADQYKQAVPHLSNPTDETLFLAHLYREKGLINLAVAAYQSVIDEEKNLFILVNDPYYWNAWSRSLTFDRRPERLEAAYRALGQIYEQQNDLDSAENAYRQIIRLLPAREQSYTSLASLLNKTNRLPETIALYEEAARTNFHLSWPFRRLAAAYLLQHEQLAERDENQVLLLEQALISLQKAQQVEPDNKENYQLLAQTYSLLNQPQQTKALYQQAAENYPYFAWPWLNLAQYYLDIGDIDAAQSSLMTAIIRQPIDQTAYNLLADIYFNQQKPENAVQVYQDAISANQGRAWPYMGLGNAYLALGKNDLALATLSDGLAKEPENAAVYATLGNIFRWNVGDPETAVQYFQQALSLNPDEPDVQMALASTLISLEQIEVGLSHLEKALALAPESAANFQTAGDIMWQLGKVEQALYYYQQALERDPQNAFAHLGLARIYRREAAYDLALEHAQKTIRFSQTIHAAGPAQMELAQIYLTLGRLDEALSHLLAAIEILPNDPWYQAAVGDYYHYQLDDPVRAVPYYQKAADLAPQQAILQAAHATALYDAGHKTQALQIMEQAVALANNDAAVYLRIGSILNKYGDWEHLVDFYETAVANGVQNAEIFNQLGNAYNALGQEEAALEQFENALQITP